MSPEDVWPRALFVCTGRIRAHDSPNKLFMELYRLDELERPVRDPMIFLISKLNRDLRLGGIYSMEAKATDADGGFQIRPRTAEFVRAHDDQHEVAAWRLRDEAAAQALAMTRNEKKLTDRIAQLEPFLKPLRREYRKMDRLGKRAMELALLAALREERIV